MRTILIIDDNPAERELIQDLLEAEGYATLCAASGTRGVELAQQRLPDLILCDIQMPDIDGYTVLSTLQRQSTTAIIPFVFLTGLSAPTNLRQGMTLGADDYLTKPLSPQELLRAIEQRFQRHAILRSQTQQPLEQLRYQIAQRVPSSLSNSIEQVLELTEQLMQEHQYLNHATIRRIAASIYTSTEHLSKAVQKFLVYIGLEILAADPEQRAELQQEHMDYPKLAIVSVAKQLAKKEGREADLQLDLDNAPVAISDTHLQRLMHEVVDNALRYSPAGTPVSIQSQITTPEFRITIVNQGAGISAEQIARLEETQAFNTLAVQRNGLGLFICKRLVELQGGSMTIVSQPNQQTTIELSLPLSDAEEV